MKEDPNHRVFAMSVAGVYPHYIAKAGVLILTRTLAKLLAPYGITVNAISPVAGTRMTLTDAYFKAREVRKAQGIVREERGVASIENLSPDDVAPMADVVRVADAIRAAGR